MRASENRSETKACSDSHGDAQAVIEAEIAVPGALLRLVRQTTLQTRLGGCEGYQIEFNLTSGRRNARANIVNWWHPNRYEPLGDVFLLSRSTDLLTRSEDSGPILSVVCRLDKDTILDLLDVVPEVTERHLQASLDIRDPRIKAALQRIAAELREPCFASNLVVELAAKTIAVDLIRRGAGIVKHSGDCELAPWKLRLIDARLREVREPPTLEALAALCEVSVRQLSRGFRASKGCSIGLYVADSQIEHAQTMLLKGDESIAAIATRLGFSNSSNFCAAFRRKTGQTPGGFRGSGGARRSAPILSKRPKSE